MQCVYRPADLAEADLVDDDDATGGGPAADHEDEQDEPLMSATSRESMRDNLATLALLAEPGAQPQIVRSGETSLEGMAREMLRPMLADWLDLKPKIKIGSFDFSGFDEEEEEEDE